MAHARNRLWTALALAAGTGSMLFSAPQAEAGLYKTDQHLQGHINIGEDKRYQSVGWVTDDLGFSCSGVLINRRWMLTAAHCVDAGRRQINVRFGNQNYSGVSWYTHRDWDGNYTNPAQGGDIALVRLDRRVMNVNPAKIFRGDPRGKVGTSVGFGSFGTGSSGNVNFLPNFKLGGRNLIDSYYRAGASNRRVFRTDMDAPGTPAPDIFGNVSADDYATTMEFSIASGDSGGGTFIGDRLAGIHSFGQVVPGTNLAFFGFEQGIERVQAYLPWIRTIQRKVNNGERIFRGVGGPDNPIDISFVGEGDEEDDATFSYLGKTYQFLSGPAAAASAQATVPEPTSAMLLGAAGLGLLARRRRRA